MKNYRYYRNRILFLEDRIEDLYYQMSGLKAISYDQIHISANEHAANLRRMILSDQISECEAEIKVKQRELDRLDKIMLKMKDIDRELFRMKYVQGLSFKKIAKLMYLSKSALFYRMNETLKKL